MDKDVLPHFARPTRRTSLRKLQTSETPGKQGSRDAGKQGRREAGEQGSRGAIGITDLKPRGPRYER